MKSKVIGVLVAVVFAGWSQTQVHALVIDSLNFEDFRDDMNLDTNTSIASSGFSLNFLDTPISMAGPLTLQGVTYTWPSADGSTGQVLQTNGSGGLTWATVSGSVAPNSLDFDDFVASASFDTNLDIATSGKNLDIGDGAFFVSGTSGNVGVGTNTLSGFARLEVNGNIFTANGTPSAPGYAFSGSGATGLYLPATSQLGVVAGGVERMRVSSAGLGIFALAPDSAPYRLEVGGSVMASSSGDVIFRLNPTNSSGTNQAAFTLQANVSPETLTISSVNNGTLVTLASTGNATFINGTASSPAIRFASSGLTGLFQPAASTIGFSVAGVERMRLDATGFGIGTTSPQAKLDINSDSFIVETAKTPSSASDACVTGMHAWDANYVYVCVATNTWKRSALSTW